MAESFGANGFRVTSEEQIEEALKISFKRTKKTNDNRSFIIDWEELVVSNGSRWKCFNRNAN